MAANYATLLAIRKLGRSRLCPTLTRMRIVSSSVELPVNYSVAPQRPQLACSTYSLEIAILNVDSYNNESTIHSYVLMQFGFVKAALMRLGAHLKQAWELFALGTIHK